MSIIKSINSFKITPIPSPSLPFVEYVLTAIDHPPHMFVSKLAACCVVLFLTRSDPTLLRELCYRWAARFQIDRMKLISLIRRRAEENGLPIASSQTQTGCTSDIDLKGHALEQNKGLVATPEDRPPEQDRNLTLEGVDGCLRKCDGINLCNPDELVDYFLRLLYSLAHMYFSWNWDCVDHIIEMNKEYENAMQRIIFPRCISNKPEDATDDEENLSFMLPSFICKLESRESPSDAASLSMFNNFSSSEKEHLSSGAARTCRSELQENNQHTFTAPTASEETISRKAPGASTMPTAPTCRTKAANSTNPESTQTDETCAHVKANQKLGKYLETNDVAWGKLSQRHPNGCSNNSVLSFMTLINFREHLQLNQTGLVIIFHAKHSAKSVEALDILSTIAQQKMIDPMPMFSVVYSVAEPELANLFDVRWFPTIVYIPENGRDTNSLSESPKTLERQHVPLSNHEEGAASCTPCFNSDVMDDPKPFGVSYKSRFPDTLLDDKKKVQDSHPHETSPYSYQTRNEVASMVGLEEKEISMDPRPLSPLVSVHSLTTTSPTIPLFVESPTKVLYGLDMPSTCTSLLRKNSLHEINNDMYLSRKNFSPSHHELSQKSKKGENSVFAMLNYHIKYPIHSLINLENLSKWIIAKGKWKPHALTTNSFVTKVVTLTENQKFKKSEDLHSGLFMLRKMQKSNKNPQNNALSDVKENDEGTQMKLMQSPSVDNASEEPPVFFFFGGGMAAGKSTIAMALAQTSWWKKHKDNIELINADDFKTINPNSTHPSSEEHLRSTRVAEKVMIETLNQGRNVVYDSTMMWAPFIRQVISMVRDAHVTLYEQGPGYLGKNQKEVYFIPSHKRKKPLPKPYRIHFMGITVDPQVAVPRGLLRKFAIGRGVPITLQLNSFKLFAQNFLEYTELMDVVALYNNNVIVDLSKGELPPILAERSMSTNDELKIYDETAYKAFLQQQFINTHACNIVEIYPPTDPCQIS